MPSRIPLSLFSVSSVPLWFIDLGDLSRTRDKRLRGAGRSGHPTERDGVTFGPRRPTGSEAARPARGGRRPSTARARCVCSTSRGGSAASTSCRAALGVALAKPHGSTRQIARAPASLRLVRERLRAQENELSLVRVVRESNPLQPECKSGALPDELTTRQTAFVITRSRNAPSQPRT